MSTSACELCGEVPDDRIDSGCVNCNPNKARLARLPEVPVVPGPADRVGCLQHGLVGCERCGKLWTRHSLTGDWAPAEDGTGWVSDESRSGGGLTLAVIVLVMLLLAAGCLWYAISAWPY